MTVQKPAEQQLQKELDKAYLKGKLPKRAKVKRETQTLFKVKAEE